MSTIIDLCNIALSRIGRGSIISLDDRSEESRQCKLYYDLCRQTLLKDYDWGFAKRIDQLAQIDLQHFGWAYVYAYPSQCLQVLRIYNDQGESLVHKNDVIDQWDIFNISGGRQALACDVTAARAEYVVDIRDATLYSAQFSDALSWRLAAELAFPLTGDANLRMNAWQFFEMTARKVKTNTARERNVDAKTTNKYVEARF